MAGSGSPEVTQLLLAWSEGDQTAFDRLVPLVYAELHRLAKRYMRDERPEHTLQTTALIHEAYVRLIDAKRVRWEGRGHFFGVAARLMRQILVDFARERGYQKRGGAVRPVSLDEALVVSGKQDEDLVAPTYDIHGAELSPDDKWVAFHLPRPGSEPVKIAPVRDGKAAAEAEWITVTDTTGANWRPWWSPDGNLLYFVSTRDNYLCIWAQPLDPATKRPHGEPLAIYHFHAARQGLLEGARFGPAVGGGRIVFALGEQSGNIWLAEPAAAER